MTINREGICRNVQIIPASREHHRYQAVVMAEVDGEVVDVLNYYDDELSFTTAELEGRTVRAVMALFLEKDKAFLLAP